MNIRFYPPREGLTYEEIRRGDIWLYADVRCPHCGNDVSVSNTHYVGGPCPKCGGLTSGASSCPVVRPQGGDTHAPTELDRQYVEAELAAPPRCDGTCGADPSEHFAGMCFTNNGRADRPTDAADRMDVV